MKTLILDNYDSFTFNLYQSIGELGGNPVVHRNDAITIDDVKNLDVSHIVIGPGPGNPDTPRDIGISEELIDYAARENIPLLGVCLGHQVLCAHFGATVGRAPALYHGKASQIDCDNSALFAGLPASIEAMRYHSLHAEESTLPDALKVTSRSAEGVVMAVEHASLPFFGVQFHPESIGTPRGMDILRNFLNNRRSHISQLMTENIDENEREKLFQEIISSPITPTLLAEAVRVLREKMITVDLGYDAIDTCGTGGSGKKTINTSTLSAFIVAACGGKVAKHGNRSASGNCGSFDLLETLGVNIALTPEQEQKIFDELGIVFLFAPLHHPALKHVAPLRKRHGKKTLFNLVGPLCNPARVTKQIIGTGNAADADLMAGALHALGSFGSMIVTGQDGLDEVTMTAATTIRTVTPDGVLTSTFTPSDLRLPFSNSEGLEGGTPQQNAEIFLSLAQGKGHESHRNLVLVNAAHTILMAGISQSIDEAFALAKDALFSGRVHDLIINYRDLTHRISS
ncbi:MAG: anthranilate phosphoribosyltransferase [Candidatus Peribacteraceae bacterium]|nr:anthranilate phosphoribosyltransferase [Candidatus Peribacteraceae bacterium]